MKVSIVLPIYNRVHTLPRCLASIFAQTMDDWELLAVDDGSTDGSAELLARLGDSRVRHLRHTVNLGAAAARNTALSEARGEFVALIDSDDEWLPTKLARQLAHLAETQHHGCGCDYWLIPQEHQPPERVEVPSAEDWRTFLHTRCELGNGTTLLARREALAEIGPLDVQLRVYEDWEWMLRFAMRFQYSVVREPLARIHGGGVRNARAFAAGAERFLALHDAEFARLGAAHRRRVRRTHYKYVASHALRHGLPGLGAKYLWRFLLPH